MKFSLPNNDVLPQFYFQVQCLVLVVWIEKWCLIWINVTVFLWSEENAKTLWRMVLMVFVEKHLELIHFRKVDTFLFDSMILFNHFTFAEVLVDSW